MISGPALFLSLFNSFALFIVFITCYGLLNPFLRKTSRSMQQILAGFFFGLFAIACMYVKIPVHEGVIVDQRNAVIVLSGAFGGPLSAVLSAAMAGAYRLYLGGGGVVAGIVGAGLAAFAGIGIYSARERVHTLSRVVFTALIATFVILPGFLFVGNLQTGWMLLKEVVLPYGSAVFLSLFFGGLLLAREEHRYEEIVRRKTREEELRRSEERYRTTLNSIGDAVIATDIEGRVVHMNPVAEILTGWSHAEALSRPLHTIFRIINEQTRHPADNPVKTVLDQGGVVGLANHTLLISRDGREIPIADSAAPIQDRQGETTGVVLVFQDQTEQREYNRKILAGEHRFRSIVENAPDPIFIQVDMRFAYLNPRAVQLFGAEYADELQGKPVMERFHPDFHDMIRNRIKMLNQDRRPVRNSLELKFIRLDGSEVWVETTGHPIMYQDRPGALVFVRDISSRIEASRESEKLQSQLNQAQKMESVGRLTGGVAHDFNNILGIIIGYAELALDRTDIDERLRSDLEKILDAAHRSSEIVRQLLAFSRQQTISPRIIDLNEKITAMLTMLRRLIGEDIELTWLPHPRKTLVKMDPAQVDQILANLCVNARDAIEGTGRIEIQTTITEIKKQDCQSNMDCYPGEFVALSVRDNGCGIGSENLHKIFEPFFTSKEVGQGTGLGLSTVYGIVKQNKGFINVSSTPGKETVFTMYIPFCPKSNEAAEEAADGNIHKGQGETILLVEDDPVLLDMTTSMLERLDYQVVAAGKPSEAVAIAAAEEIDMLLTDVVMPGMNGKELADILKRHSPGLKLLFMSGYTAGAIVERGILAKGINFIQKPFTSSNLALKIREVLES